MDLEVIIEMSALLLVGVGAVVAAALLARGPRRREERARASATVPAALAGRRHEAAARLQRRVLGDVAEVERFVEELQAEAPARRPGDERW